MYSDFNGTGVEMCPINQKWQKSEAAWPHRRDEKPMSPPHFDIHVLSGWSQDTKLEVEQEPKLAYLWESKNGIEST